MTPSQQQALDNKLARWGIPLNTLPIEHSEYFGNANPVAMEVGFGMGDSLAQMAENHPDYNFIGVEVHPPGVGRLLALIEKKGLRNLRLVNADVVEVLQRGYQDPRLQRINIYFPDPWHKKKHHKRRLIQPEFLTLLHRALARDGLLHIATDWQPYAEHIFEVLQQQPLFENVAGQNGTVDAAEYGRPETKFERRGQRLGHGVWDMVFRALPAKQ